MSALAQSRPGLLFLQNRPTAQQAFVSLGRALGSRARPVSALCRERACGSPAAELRVQSVWVWKLPSSRAGSIVPGAVSCLVWSVPTADLGEHGRRARWGLPQSPGSMAGMEAYLSAQCARGVGESTLLGK